MSRLNLKANPDNPVEVALLEYLEANASDSLAERINAGNKTIGGCYRYIEKEAEKRIPKNKRTGAVSVPMPREECYGLAIHYFEEDSIKEVEEKKAPTPPPTAPASSPVKAKSRGKGKAKVAVQSAESLDLDSMLAECGIEVAGDEKKPEPKPEPEPEVPPSPAERKEPVQTDWLTEFGISI